MPADAKAGTSLRVFTPPYMIDLFASQRALVVGTSYDGAGTCESIEATPHGVVVTFSVAKQASRRMLLSAAGWGWFA